MNNPILSKLNNGNNMLGLLGALKNGNPDAIFNQMMQSNPQFANFVKTNQGKSPEQIARENGIDLGMLNQFLR